VGFLEGCVVLIAVSMVAQPRASHAVSESCADPVGIWTDTFDNPSFFDLAIDTVGGIYRTGYGGSQGFDPSGGLDVFLSKLNPDGSYAWTRTFGGGEDDFGSAAAIDPEDDVWVAGSFQLTVDFDPSDGVDERTASGGANGFVSEFDPQGNYAGCWILGAGASAGVTALAIDGEGGVIAVGAFWGSGDFDPTEGLDVRSGDADVFVTKVTIDGSYGWTRTFGGPIYYDVAQAVRVDSVGNVFVYGRFRGTVDFDPGAGHDWHTGTIPDTLFVTKLHADGSYGWTHVLQVQISEVYDPIEVDENGDIWLVGGFRNFVGAVDFDPTPSGADERFTEGLHDVFVSKWHNDGSYAWTRTFSGNGAAYGVTPDLDGGVAVTGEFNGIMDFDPGPAVEERVADTSGNVFVTKLNADGTWRWTRTIDGPRTESGQFLERAPDGGLIVAGDYFAAPDFDPGCAVDERDSKSSDGYIAKLGCVPSSADTDADGDVDLADAAKFQNCFSGASPTACPSGCYALDFDSDDDIDLADYAILHPLLANP